MPTAPTPWGSVSQEFHCPLPPGNAAVYCRSCAAQCPRAVRQSIAGVPLPLPPGSEAVHCKGCTARCP